MKTTTLKQMKRILELLEDTPSKRTQAMLESGLFTDIRDADYSVVIGPKVRAEVRRLLGVSDSGRTPEIRISALTKMASSEICQKYGFASVECDNSPEGEVVLVLDSVLRDGETSISGKEYETRLRTVSGTLGLSQALWLVEHQDEFPEFMAPLGEGLRRLSGHGRGGLGRRPERPVSGPGRLALGPPLELARLRLRLQRSRCPFPQVATCPLGPRISWLYALDAWALFLFDFSPLIIYTFPCIASAVMRL